MEIAPGAAMTLKAQISPDGLFWCDADNPGLGRGIHETGLYSFAMRDFGQWLRLVGELSGAGPRVKVMIYLALKE
jgi:hypothetical protein